MESENTTDSPLVAERQVDNFAVDIQQKDNGDVYASDIVTDHVSNTSDIVLGLKERSNELTDIRLSKVALTRGLSISGSTGTGKSRMAELIVHQLFEDGSGGLFIPTKQLPTHLLQSVSDDRFDDIVVVTNREYGYDCIEIGHEHTSLLVDFIAHRFTHNRSETPDSWKRLHSWLSSFIHAVIDIDGGEDILSTLSTILHDSDSRLEFLQQIQSRDKEPYHLPPLTQMFDKVSTSTFEEIAVSIDTLRQELWHENANSDNSLPISDAISNGKLVIFDTSHSSHSQTVSYHFLTELFWESVKEIGASTDNPYVFAIDEMPHDIGDPRTPDFEETLSRFHSRGRSMNVARVFTYQYPAQIPQNVRHLVDNAVFFNHTRPEGAGSNGQHTYPNVASRIRSLVSSLSVEVSEERIANLSLHSFVGRFGGLTPTTVPRRGSENICSVPPLPPQRSVDDVVDEF